MTAQTGFQLGIITTLILLMIGFMTGVIPAPDPIRAVAGRWLGAG